MLNQFSSEHRDLHSSVSRVGKSVDKNFISDYVCVGNENLFDQEDNAIALNKVIVEHFLRQGRSDIAEQLIKEAKLDINKRDKIPYIKMNKILGKLQKLYVIKTLINNFLLRCIKKSKPRTCHGMGKRASR